MPVLTINNLSFSYDDINIIKNLNLQLKKNELISIVGSSGCGKSTIIKLIAGIEKNYLGDINGLNTSYMPQKDLLLPWRTVLENVLLPIELKNSCLKTGKEKAIKFLKKLELDEYQNYLPQQLSGGMRQRVSFIRTLLNDGDILLLDEPFSALDAITKEELQKWLLKNIREFNKSMIFITHDINEAIFLSDRILVCKEKPIEFFQEFSIPKDITLNESIELKNKILKVIKGEN